MIQECPRGEHVIVEIRLVPFPSSLGRGQRGARKFTTIPCSRTAGKRNEFALGMTTEQKARYGLCEDCPFC